MIIDRTARVVPPRYPDRFTRQVIGDSLGKADESDLLASFLWVEELKLGSEGCEALTAHRDDLTKWLENACGYRRAPRFRGREWACTRVELDELLDALASGLSGEIAFMESALKTATEAFEELRSLPSRALGDLYAPVRTDSPLNVILDQWYAAEDSVERCVALHSLAAEGLKRLEETDERRSRFARTEQSYTLGQIQNFDGTDFEALVAWLAYRDEMKVQRARGGKNDRGADVIAETPDGRRVVAQCKHSSKGSKHTVTSTNVQTFNGTARPEHQADIPVMVTNGTFSEPAREFARDHAIHLIGSQELERWATWGDSLYEVVGVPVPSPASPSD
ncbi:restriction endonuclease [Streptomyces arenae]|uniref:restriction endonuclease n=1 Tax=Streptomyces arenae TaxID=29301 RepID=UPI00265ADF5D|nr:restriction endonuclease [Streptomyces arenae]MCG7204733.1 restriction endonuclease [Streptomyces arenae]